MAQKDGMNYAPKGIPAPVVKEGEFPFAAVGLDHGHIYGMTNGLLDAGATLKWVYDPDPAKMQAFKARYPQVRLAESEEQVLADPAVKLVAGACVTSERAALGVRVMRAGKDYFTDKAPLTTLEQLAMVKNVVAETGRKYAVNYSERLQVEAAVYAGELVKAGAIGRVVQVIGMGPHRLNPASRPAWFFEKEKYGGILCDIGSHQIEQFLFYTGADHRQRQDRELRPPRIPGAGRLWRRDAGGRQRRQRLFPRRLVHARRPSQLGRRAHLPAWHRRLHRTAQISGRGPQRRGQPCVLGRQGGRAL